MGSKNFAQDYTQMCRTCLQSDVEMISLSAFIIDNIKEETSKISYMDCLKMWIQIEELASVEMPKRICLECASALQVAYWFTKNASQAQELLKIKLEDIRRKSLQIEKETPTEDDKKPKRYRCKICNVKVETKRSLKDHIKLHLDIIVYNCQMCTYETHSRNTLSEHYIQIHCVEATKEQLKPQTKLSTTSNLTSSNITANVQTDSDTHDQYFQVLPEDSQQISCQTFANPTTTRNSSYSTGGALQMSTIIAANSNYTTISAPFDALDGEINSDIKLANEFMVMADGSLEKVLNKGVVIEYINTQNNDGDLKLDNNLVIDDIMQVQGIGNTVMLGQQNIGQMDIDDIIIEEQCDVTEELGGNVILPLDEETIPASFIEQPKKIMCKICTKDFLTQEQLKNHMLTHNEIPHFFCDQCTFYTFFKIDLHQHYKSKHNLQPTNKQLQPKNKQKTIDVLYACDLCLYEADEKSDLKNHYIMKHNFGDIEIHSKTLKAEKLKSKLPAPLAKAKTVTVTNKTTPSSTSKNLKFKCIEPSTPPDYPNGLNCRKCHELFFFRNKLYEHYKLHNAEEAAKKQEKQNAKFQSNTTSSNLYENNTKNVNTTPVQTQKNAQNQLESNKSNFSAMASLNVNVTTPNISTHTPVAPLTTTSSSTYILPSDAIPQIVETDQTIENMDFEFNCDDDALFGDFDGDVDVENDPDENDLELRNVVLTSDDDFEDMLADQNDVNNDSAEAITTGSYCAHCQKSFLSQYQFENHMFVHRGLAPYRCEMCTNLYNTKRCLIRHYRAVHKIVPTRDMIQAKGDKVCDDKSLVEHSTLEAKICLMCAKCPYESSELDDIKFHLKSSHNINDESYIMKKQPFECQRCIRSFASKVKLFRHLDRNHSLTPINQKHRFNSMKNTSEIAAGTSVAVAAINHSNNSVNMMKTENSDSSASSGKINKVMTSASTTKFLTSNPIQTANINNYNNHNNPLNSS